MISRRARPEGSRLRNTGAVRRQSHSRGTHCPGRSSAALVRTLGAAYPARSRFRHGGIGGLCARDSASATAWPAL
jgi:hypothetical protein